MAFNKHFSQGILGSTDEVTIEFWVTTSPFDYSSSCSSNGWVRFFQFSDQENDNGAGLVMNRYSIDGTIMFGMFGDGGGELRTTVQFCCSSMHIAVVLTKNSPASLYINGSFMGSSTFPISWYAATTTYNIIGAGTDHGQCSMHGSFAEFRIWNNGLSSSTILDHFQQGPDRSLLQYSDSQIIHRYAFDSSTEDSGTLCRYVDTYSV